VFVSVSVVKTGFEWYYIAWIAQIAGVAFFIGILFLIGWRRKKKGKPKR
jgi:ABC-type Fe3+-siderophore transport system permease subunit